MKNAVKNGAPSSCNRQEAERGSADQGIALTGIKARADAPSITFSGVILRALDARPQNEDQIRGLSS